MGLQPAVVKLGGKKVLLMVTPKDSYSLGPMFLTKPSWYNREKSREKNNSLRRKRFFRNYTWQVFILHFNIFASGKASSEKKKKKKKEILGYLYKEDPTRESKSECKHQSSSEKGKSPMRPSNTVFLGDEGREGGGNWLPHSSAYGEASQSREWENCLSICFHG